MTTTNNKTLNFTDYNTTVARMTISEIRDQITSIQFDLPHADAIDREDNTCYGGYLRDKISVLRQQLVTKTNDAARCHTVKLTSFELDMIKAHRKAGNEINSPKA